jgi:hypothetical protein
MIPLEFPEIERRMRKNQVDTLIKIVDDFNGKA